jgi:hypothetical protein
LHPSNHLLDIGSLKLIKFAMGRFIADVGPRTKLLCLELVEDTGFLQVVDQRIKSLRIAFSINGRWMRSIVCTCQRSAFVRLENQYKCREIGL